MNNVLLATISGVITALCWGTTDWISSKLTKKFKKLEMNFAFQLPSILIMIPILVIVGQPLPSINLILRLCLISCFFIVAFLFLLKALSMGSVGVVVPIANTYSLLTLALSSIFIGVVFSNFQIIAIAGIVLGVVLLVYEKNHEKIPIRVHHKATIYALFASAFWGLGFFLVDTVIGKVSWQMLTGITSTFMVIFSFILIAITNRGEIISVLKKSLSIKLALFGGVIAQIGVISLYIGSDRSGSVVIPVVIASSSPLIASCLSTLYDNEKLGLIKRIGAVVVVAGIIALNLI